MQAYSWDLRQAWNHLSAEDLDDPLDFFLKQADPLKQAWKRPKFWDDESVPGTLPSAAAGSLEPSEASFMSCVKQVDALSWREQLEGKLNKALKRWYALILSWEARLDIVDQVCSPNLGEGLEILGDVLKHKAPSTLMKRVNSLVLLDKELAKLGKRFPPDEADLYFVLRQLRKAGRSVSCRKGILEAVAFCCFVLGVEECHHLTISRRCRGSCFEIGYLSKGQASPLLVCELLHLHELVHSAHENWNAVMAGAILLAVYCRARWMDLQCSETLVLDGPEDDPVYADVTTARHKTMQTRLHKFQFLTMTAPCLGVDARQWMKAWVERCKRVGFTPCEGYPIMPAPDQHGRPSLRPLDSAEMSSWMRNLLKDCKRDASLNVTGDRRISSHSCKCTLLSMMAKFGASVEVRACLGYHACGNSTVFRYSRDAAAGPLHELSIMLQRVRSSEFMPDATRSGRWNVPSDQWQGQSKNLELDWYEPARSREEEYEPDFPEQIEEFHLPPTEAAECEVSPRDEPSEGQRGDEPNENFNSWSVAGSSTEVGQGSHFIAGGDARAASEDECVGSSSSDEASECEAPRNFLARLEVPTPPHGMRFLRHAKSRVCHIIKNEHKLRFQCGRMVTSAYGPPGEVQYDTSVCRQCVHVASSA